MPGRVSEGRGPRLCMHIVQAQDVMGFHTGLAAGLVTGQIPLTEAECLIHPSLLHPSIPGTGLGSRNSRQQENNSTDCGGADSLGTVGCHGNRRKLILGSGTYPLWSLGAPPAFTSSQPTPFPGCAGMHREADREVLSLTWLIAPRTSVSLPSTLGRVLPILA